MKITSEGTIHHGGLFTPHKKARVEPLLRKVAEALWTADGGVLRLLDEITRPGTELERQQSACWRRARAVLAALERP
jgi:hypothetical protein